MSKAYKLKTENGDILLTMNVFFRKLLAEGVVNALLVPQASPGKTSVFQSLVREADHVKDADPFAPILLMNSATLAGQVTIDEPKEKIGAVLRSCEIRAAIELAKLKQVNPDRLVIIGVDCMGTYESQTYKETVGQFDDIKTFTKEYLSKSTEARAGSLKEEDLRLACRGCEYPNPENSGITINFLGCDVNKEIIVQISDDLADVDPEKLGLVPADDISGWEQASKSCRERRVKFGEESIKETLDRIKDIKGFLKQLGHCRRCYNCRKECPICYCRECIFDSKTFEHESGQYLDWAGRKGRIRMPTDTLLYHLTRMNHMVVSCVACGQCTSACPNGIEVARHFKAIGSKVQGVFDYKPGKSVEEDIPQSTFQEEEFTDMGEGPPC